MLVPFSSSNNDSLLLPQLSIENSSIQSSVFCYMTRPNSFIIIALYLSKVFIILPLSITILYHGLQEWKRKLSTSSAATTGHINSFTYHLAIMEFILVLGSILFSCGIYISNLNMIACGIVFINFVWYGETFLHVLTCVERYLAVVHPFTYLSLKNERGVRIRNISIICVWLLCFVSVALMIMMEMVEIILDFCHLIFSLSVISFCSLSVLCVLVRPFPGDQSDDRGEVDQSKKKAFLIIFIILSSLVVRLTWNLVRLTLNVRGEGNNCVMIICGFCFQLPSSLVLPLLFLQRTGKLKCFMTNRG